MMIGQLDWEKMPLIRAANPSDILWLFQDLGPFPTKFSDGTIEENPTADVPA